MPHYDIVRFLRGVQPFGASRKNHYRDLVSVIVDKFVIVLCVGLTTQNIAVEFLQKALQKDFVLQKEVPGLPVSDYVGSSVSFKGH